jgi:hypothetical protein
LGGRRKLSVSASLQVRRAVDAGRRKQFNKGTRVKIVTQEWFLRYAISPIAEARSTTEVYRNRAEHWQDWL